MAGRNDIPRAEHQSLILRAIDEMIDEAPTLGLCPILFRTLREDVLWLIQENNDLRKTIGRAE